jgi:hypothetical protein
MFETVCVVHVSLSRGVGLVLLSSVSVCTWNTNQSGQAVCMSAAVGLQVALLLILSLLALSNSVLLHGYGL